MTAGLDTSISVVCDVCGSAPHRELLAATVRRPLADSDFTVFGEQQEYPRIVRCESCGLVYANPRDDTSGLVAKYEGLDLTGYLSEEDSRRRTCQHDVRSVQRFVSGGRLLDVGCSAGLFLSCLPASFEPHGIEPGAYGSGHAARLVGENAIRQGTVESVSYPDRSFDAITMWDVIEHLPSPKAALLRLGGWLKPGGHLFLVTPDFGSLFARASGRRWAHLIRQHLYYFERSSLQRLLDAAGFDVVEEGTYTRHFTLGYVAQRTGLVARDWQPRSSWLRAPSGWCVPINVGDALFVVARRRTDVTGIQE